MGLRAFLAFVALGLMVSAQPDARAGDPPACREIRFADIGWTDITTTTAITARLFESLGYQPKIQVLSVPITYLSLKNKYIDVFLGNWMPTMEGDRAPYIADGSVDVVGANLTGAKYTMAVPDYLYQQGLHSFSDIAHFRRELGGKIYGLEPGNDGDRVALALIQSNRYGLGGFDLVESSEQGMLAELDRAVRHQEPIVFLGWEPHPMNQKFSIRYLDDSENSFGPDNGGAAVFTNVRHNWLQECPNAGTLVRNLKFTLAQEDKVMGAILFEGTEPSRAAEAWLKSAPEVWAGWLEGVTTFDGQPAKAAVEADLGLKRASGGLDQWFATHRLPVGPYLEAGVSFATSHGQVVFDAISRFSGGLLDSLTRLLAWFPPLILIGIFAALAYWLHRSIGLSIFIVASLLLVVDLGYWRATVETLSLVFSATLTCVAVGVPLGIVAAHRPWFYKMLRPVLDLMQTIPTFVYLIPTLVLFGLGAVPGLISTVIFAIPAPIRLTHLGITSVPEQLREAGQAFGATRWQLLFKVELPYALPTIMAGITQCIMLSLSMVVIASLVGADGLGKPVVRALNSVNVSMGFEAGLAIVVLAIILDRVCKRPEPRQDRR
jgi:glycine betaine/proline transport system substrate-binding protein